MAVVTYHFVDIITASFGNFIVFVDIITSSSSHFIVFVDIITSSCGNLKKNIITSSCGNFIVIVDTVNTGCGNFIFLGIFIIIIISPLWAVMYLPLLSVLCCSL